MTLKQIASAEPEYLAAADVLIGDMSDTNYEFLLFDRPVVLLANGWLVENFPDIGIKTDVAGLESAIRSSLDSPSEFADQRRHWLERTIHRPFEKASPRVLKTAIEKSGFRNPTIAVIHGNSDVRKTNLEPLHREALAQGLNSHFLWHSSKIGRYRESIFFAAHFDDLNIKHGYKVHLDHGLKGKGTANVDMSLRDYKRNRRFPLIDLHIVAGEAGKVRTELLVGPYRDRVVVCGYPKADSLNRLNTDENKLRVARELNFDSSQPLIAYASAGPESHAKPGGSFHPTVLKELERIGQTANLNILIKLKQRKRSTAWRALNRIRKIWAERVALCQ